ncbi:MAG: hypothetical protein ABI210_01890 [Abditibacteriaceae bacterium]
MATKQAVPGRFKKPPKPGETRVIRTTDSPNCTGACGWNATVMDDTIIDLKPAADYGCEEYNPRGCLRGMSMTHMISAKIASRRRLYALASAVKVSGKKRRGTKHSIISPIK